MNTARVGGAADSPIILECRLPDACVGGSNFTSNGNGYCKEGYTGPLCDVVKPFFGGELEQLGSLLLQSDQWCLSQSLRPVAICEFLVVDVQDAEVGTGEPEVALLWSLLVTDGYAWMVHA